MDSVEKKSSEAMEQAAMDVEFIPYVLFHRIHRNLKSSQVEIVPLPYYVKEITPEPEPESEMEIEPEIATRVVFAPPLPAFKEKKNWWDFFKPIYEFNNPLIRARLEKLMNSRIVQVMDRKYMLKLQERIKEDHLENVKKRIQEREEEEIEREKILLLEGKIPIEEAPKELKNHPVCRINRMAQKIIGSKRKYKPLSKTSAYKTCLRRIKAAEKIEKETVFEKEIEIQPDTQGSGAVCIVDADVEEDINKGFMFSKEEYDNLKYEDPMIALLREIDTVHDMYDVADRILGSLKPRKSK